MGSDERPEGGVTIWIAVSCLYALSAQHTVYYVLVLDAGRSPELSAV